MTKTKIKFCGLSRPCDIEAANELKPDFIGFVFAQKSRRYVTPDRAATLRSRLAPGIRAVGVFVDEAPEHIAELVWRGIIDMAQLHGNEDIVYLQKLRKLCPVPVIKAYRIASPADVEAADASRADCILLDGPRAGSGAVFDWSYAKNITRAYFLAGGLHPDNVADAITALHPFAVDVSSGIESGGCKDKEKMRRFIEEVRRGEDLST
ncbi:MAG: phosphoribosylanthranilate isomerase [Clostridia bacterium]|nr:phosphoribosylanthranilate isomerase [Clostridia bacterium]